MNPLIVWCHVLHRFSCFVIAYLISCISLSARVPMQSTLFMNLTLSTKLGCETVKQSIRNSRNTIRVWRRVVSFSIGWRVVTSVDMRGTFVTGS